MASWSRTERVTKVIDYKVPNGYTAQEFDVAWSEARDEWKQRYRSMGYADGDDVPGDWATIHGTDECVIIRITINLPIKIMSLDEKG